MSSCEHPNLKVTLEVTSLDPNKVYSLGTATFHCPDCSCIFRAVKAEAAKDKIEFLLVNEEGKSMEQLILSAVIASRTMRTIDAQKKDGKHDDLMDAAAYAMQVPEAPDPAKLDLHCPACLDAPTVDQAEVISASLVLCKTCASFYVFDKELERLVLVPPEEVHGRIPNHADEALGDRARLLAQMQQKH